MFYPADSDTLPGRGARFFFNIYNSRNKKSSRVGYVHDVHSPPGSFVVASFKLLFLHTLSFSSPRPTASPGSAPRRRAALFSSMAEFSFALHAQLAHTAIRSMTHSTSAYCFLYSSARDMESILCPGFPRMPFWSCTLQHGVHFIQEF